MVRLFFKNNHKPVGYDYKNGSFNPFSQEAKAMEIFAFHYDKKKTYASPEKPEIIWNVPDELIISTRISTLFNSLEGDFMTFHAVQTVKIVGWNIGGGFTIDGFGVKAEYSREIGHIREWAEMKINDIFISNIIYTTYYAEPLSYLFLEFSDPFTMFVQMLPRKVVTEKDKKILKEFILKYGTHFPEDGYFGGKNHYDSSLKITFVNSTTVDWCNQEFKMSFYYNTWDLTIGGGIYINKSEIHVDSKYTKNADTQMFFEGGFLKYQTNKTLKEWKDSLFNIQAMTNGTLTPLWELIEDEQKCAVVKKAIHDYIGKKGYFDWDTFKDDGLLKGVEYINSGFNTVFGKGAAKIFEFNGNHDVNVHYLYEKSSSQVSVHNSVFSFAKEVHPLKYGGTHVHQSRELFDFYKNYLKNDQIKVNSYKRYSKYSLSMKDNVDKIKKTDLFVNWVNKLPYKYDLKEYFKFFKTFGTHYVNKVTMGGEMKMEAWIDKNVYENNEFNNQAFVKEAKERFEHEIGLCNNCDDLEHEFMGSNNIKHYNHGGKISTKTWDEFEAEMENDNIVPVYYNLKPLYELVEDSIVKKNMERAIEDYEYYVGVVKIKEVLEFLMD